MNRTMHREIAFATVLAALLGVRAQAVIGPGPDWVANSTPATQRHQVRVDLSVGQLISFTGIADIHRDPPKEGAHGTVALEVASADLISTEPIGILGDRGFLALSIGDGAADGVVDRDSATGLIRENSGDPGETEATTFIDSFQFELIVPWIEGSFRTPPSAIRMEQVVPITQFPTFGVAYQKLTRDIVGLEHPTEWIGVGSAQFTIVPEPGTLGLSLWLIAVASVLTSPCRRSGSHRRGRRGPQKIEAVSAPIKSSPCGCRSSNSVSQVSSGHSVHHL